ncbi:MAG: type II toxin-antitoxin system RelE/ParE family toxin [Nitrospirales bacterium]|nr:type II toxin-antitoxin system RelE/ParE family toxin [Nitrospira sp.]MDR4501465.1 type II toxin-antitoxin system RelE/ParE family toxin [Nitrospirales bacterium]
MPAFHVDIPPHVADVIRQLPPDIKRSMKSAIRTLCANPSEGEPLVKELKGLWKFRVRRFRIVYGIDRRKKVIRLFAVGHRRSIYETVTEQVSRRPQETS